MTSLPRSCAQWNQWSEQKEHKQIPVALACLVFSKSQHLSHVKLSGVVKNKTCWLLEMQFLWSIRTIKLVLLWEGVKDLNAIVWSVQCCRASLLFSSVVFSYFIFVQVLLTNGISTGISRCLQFAADTHQRNCKFIINWYLSNYYTVHCPVSTAYFHYKKRYLCQS